MRYTQTDIQLNWLKKICHPTNGLKSLYALVYNCFGIKLYYYQLETLRAMLNPKINQMLCSYARQSGKSTVISVYMALAPMLFNDVNIYVFGPKLEQAQIPFGRAASFIRTNKWNLYSGSILEDKADRMKFSNNVEIRAVSASLNSEIEGLTVHSLILDECENISSYKIKESITPMGAAVNAKIMQFGVPRAMGTYWHESWKNPSYFKFIYPWEKCLRPQGNLDREYVLQRKEEDPVIFATQFELKWNEDMSTFISYDNWLACELDYKLEDEKIKGNFWGVDFGRQKDSTVITEYKYDIESDSGMITNWWELQGIDYAEQINFMQDIYHSEVELILCDSSSIGPMIEIMVERGLPARGMNFDQHNKDKLYKYLRSKILQKKVHWPKKECYDTPRQRKLYNRFIQQCTDLEVDYKSTGLISVHHPDFGSARDDFPDSTALAVYASSEFVTPNATFWG